MVAMDDGPGGWISQPEPPLTKGSPLCGLFASGKQKSTIIPAHLSCSGIIQIIPQKKLHEC